MFAAILQGCALLVEHVLDRSLGKLVIWS